MITKEKMISDVELQLLQSDPSDDSPLEKSQIAFWLTYILNETVTAELGTKIKNGDFIPGIYLRRMECLPTEAVMDSCGNYRIKVDLSNDVLTLLYDNGIVLVEDDMGNQIKKTSTELLSVIKRLRFSAPNESNLVYHREGPRTIYIHGLKTPDIPFEKVYVTHVPKQDLLELADTDEVLVSDYIYRTVIDMTVEKGMNELYGTQADIGNDGVDPKNSAYHQMIRNRTKLDPNEQPQ